MGSIMPTAGLMSGAVRDSGVREAPKVQKPESEVPERSRKPVMDQYIPEEKREPSGLYWMGQDENGQPKVYFDNPERTSDGSRSSEERPAPGLDRKGLEKKEADGKAERCTGSTDQVDREIERLKRKREELERQISAEPDEVKAKALERKLAQVERELSRKDNDTYRRRHTVFS